MKKSKTKDWWIYMDFGIGRFQPDLRKSKIAQRTANKTKRKRSHRLKGIAGHQAIVEMFGFWR